MEGRLKRTGKRSGGAGEGGSDEQGRTPGVPLSAADRRDSENPPGEPE